MNNETLGQRIRRLREACGISQVAMARRLGASTNAINLLEQDSISDPHWLRMVAIAEILEVSLDELAGRPARSRQRKPPAPADGAKEEAA